LFVPPKRRKNMETMKNSDRGRKTHKKIYGLFQVHFFDFINAEALWRINKDCLIVITRKKMLPDTMPDKRWFHGKDQETTNLALNFPMFV